MGINNVISLLGGGAVDVVVYSLIALAAVWLIISPCITNGKLDMNDRND